MRSLGRYFIVILAVAVGVSSTGIPVVSPSPATALAEEPQCPPNNDDSSIPSGADSRCIAEEMRSTRAAYIKPACLDSRALTTGVEYSKHECHGGSKKVWLEAIAQARAIMRLNSAGYANDSSLDGVTPNIQWEVSYPKRDGIPKGGRVDILLYDRASTEAPIELIEVKSLVSSSGAAAAGQLDDYVRDFPAGPLDRPVRPFDLGNYGDDFSVVFSSCEEGASEREVRDYHVSPYELADGVLLVDRVETRVTPCDDPDGDPVIIPPGSIRLAPPGMDEDQNGIDDFNEQIRREIPELDSGLLVDYEDLGLEHVVVPAAVFAVIVAAVSVCTATPCMSAVVGALISGWSGLAGAEAAATAGTALAAAVAAILGLIAINVWGDPHMVTFDGLKYDLQSAGEFHIFEVPSEYVDIQARFLPVGSSVSVMSRVATEIHDTTVEFEGNSLWVNGEPATLPASGFLDLGDNAGITRVNGQWVVLWPGYGDRLMMKVNGDRLGIHVPAGSPPVRGLLGNANGDPYDDVALRDGTVLTQPLSSNTLHSSYADSWRLSPDESMFTYELDESTATFTDPTFPSSVVTLADLDPQDVNAARQQCQASGVVNVALLDACTLDVAVTGASSMIEGSLSAPQPVVAIEGSYISDFENGDGTGWSSPGVVTSQSGTEKFLGVHADESNRLTLNSLPGHTDVTLSFDLYVLGGWDGESGPDEFKVSVVGGSTLLDTSFSNTAGTQGYPSASSAAQSGAVAVDTLGSYGGDGSAIYHFEYTFGHWQPTLQIDFTGLGVSAGAGEFWGVDNVEVQLARLVPGYFDYEVDDVFADLLEAPGAEDYVTFDVPSGGLNLFFDWQGCPHNTNAVITDSAGNPVSMSSIGHCAERFFSLAEGTYTLRVFSSEASTVGQYGFQIWVVPDPEVFSYTINGVVSDGVPAAGAGNLESVGAEDQYTFSVPSGGMDLFFDWQGCVFNSEAQILDSAGNPVSMSSIGHCKERFFSLTEGTYTLRVWSPGTASVGTYGFKVWDVPAPEVFSYTIDDVVSNGVPAAGAGNLESVGAEDQYTISVPAGGLNLSFDWQGCVFNSEAQILDSAGNPVSMSSIGHCKERTFTLPEGTYTLRVWSPGIASVGTYGFAIDSLGEAGYTIDEDDLTLGSVYSGVIAPLNQDHLTFSLSQDSEFFVDVISTFSYFRYRLVDESTESVVIAERYQDSAVTSLPAGDYRLEVYGLGTNNGNYSLAAYATDATAFTYTPGTTVSNGIPASGAGVIEAPLARDHLTFSVSVDSQVFVDVISTFSYFRYRLVDANSGATVIAERYQDSAVTALPAGDYRLEVYGLGTNNGSYSLKVHVTDAEQIAYTPGTTVSSGVPAAGAGVIEAPLARDHLTFSVSVDSQVFVDVISTFSYFRYRLVNASTGATVIAERYQDSAVTALPAGDYRLEVYGLGTNNGSYSLNLSATPS